MDAVPGRKRLVVGIRQQDGQHDLLQQRKRHVGGTVHDDGQHDLPLQRERHGGGKGHDDGQHDLLLQREWHGCGNCDYVDATLDFRAFSVIRKDSREVRETARHPEEVEGRGRDRAARRGGVQVWIRRAIWNQTLLGK